MTKNELISKLAEKTGTTKVAARALIDALIESLSGAIGAKGTVTLKGFGTFTVRDRAARTVRNPASGEPVSVAARRTVVFKSGEALKARINGKR